MENFVLNLFSDQLSKVILNFNDAKMKINASFMAGKGSITNVKLNVDLLNDLLTKPPHGLLPYLRLKEATITELRLEVTSYTNLKKAPVVLVIDEVFVEAEEMMEYYFDGKHNNASSIPGSAAAGATNDLQINPSVSAKPASKRTVQKQTPYGLLHRITDNLSIRINKIHISFQPLGKFKTRRVGVWTPPRVNVTLENVEWISVTQYGEVGTPEQIWAHNDLSAQQANLRQNAARAGGGHHHRIYTIFKRLSFKAGVGLVDAMKSNAEQSKLISDCKMDMHVAYTRRLRDAGITGVDVDVLCHDADVKLDLSVPNTTTEPLGCSFQSVLHLMAGLQHCMYKDRSFVDPLLPVGVSRESTKKIEKSDITGKECFEVELGPDDFMPAVNMEDDDSSESSEDEEEPDEEHDEAFLAWKKDQGLDVDVPANADISMTEGKSVVSESDGAVSDGLIPQQVSSQSLLREEPPPKYKRKRKAVIVLASGAQKFEKLSFSFAARRINLQLFLPNDDAQMHHDTSPNAAINRHCIELMAESAMVECIWPKPNGEIGGNVQCSLRYLHVMESVHQFSDVELKNPAIVRYLPLLKIGCRLFDGKDVFSLTSHYSKKVHNGNSDNIMLDDEDGFPLMEKRQVSWKWARPGVNGPAALSLKSTVSFVDETLALWSKTFVVHEVNIGEIEVCIDSDPLARLAKVLTSVPWDDRWLSGEWTEEITEDMLVDGVQWYIKNHLQPLPGWYGSASGKLSSLSSDLRSITARFGGIAVRVPHPVYSFSSCGLADVVCSVSSATLLVTSQLPVSFLNGTITASDGLSTSFPNDESDNSCKDSESLMPNPTSKFRVQVTLSDFSLKVVPLPQLSTDDDRSDYLIAPTKITTMMNLQHKYDLQSLDGATESQQLLVVSALIQSVKSNVVVERALSAAMTMNHHMTKIMRCAQKHSYGHDGRQSTMDNTIHAMTSIVCVHISDVSIILATNGTRRGGMLQLCALELRNIEIGSESTISPNVDSNVDALDVHKCVIGGFSMKMLSKNSKKFIDLVSIGMGDLASTFDDSASGGGEGSIMLRACRSSSNTHPTTLTVAVDVASELAVVLDIAAIQAFYDDVAMNVLSAPVYFYIKTDHNTIETFTQPLMAALLSYMFDVSASIGNSEVPNANKKLDTSFIRMLLSNVSVKVSNTASANADANFLLTFDRIDLTVGHLGSKAQLDSPLMHRRCGRDDQWRTTMIGRISSPGTFYALKSIISLISADERSKEVFPAFSIDWNSIDGDEQAKELIDTSLTVGMLMSYLGMKLYFMLPNKSSKSLVAKDTRDIHSMIGRYHSEVLGILSHSEEMIEQLRLLLFGKERERLGMLSIVTPTMSGWLRIHEGSSLSFNRLFTTATFCRYWVVLKSSLVVCYESPGAPIPSLVFPLSVQTTSLRVITMPSASGSAGIVGNHLQQKGFALFDSGSDIELFCVASDLNEYKKWASAISSQLKQGSTLHSDDPEQSKFEVPQPITTEEDNATSFETISTSDPSPPTIRASIVDESAICEHHTAGEDCSTIEHQPAPILADEIALDDSEIELDTISLSGSDETLLDPSDPSSLNPDQHTIQEAEQPRVAQIPQEAKASTMVQTRDILKKSRFASSKLNSALKTAKGGMLAASEKGRDGLKQALEASASSNTTAQTRAEIGLKFSGLKQNANVKMSKLSTAVRVSVQEHTKPSNKPVQQVGGQTLNSGLETLGSESQVLEFPNNSAQLNRQDQMKKKLANLDQSMSTTMRRLKIDEKLNSIGTAVRNAASEGQVVARQISSTGSVSQLKSEQRLQRSIKMDGRETFSSHSVLPVKVKSMKAGGPLVLHDDDYIHEKCQSLSKIEGNWIIDVQIHKVEREISSSAPSSFNVVESQSMRVNDGYLTGRKQLKFKLYSTETSTGTAKVVSKTLSEILIFHATISEELASYFNCAAEIAYREATGRTYSLNPLLNKLTSLEHVRVSGSILEGVLQASNSLDSIYEGHCQLVQDFLHTLVASNLPPDAIKTTEDFLRISDMPAAAPTRTMAHPSIVDSANAPYEYASLPKDSQVFPRRRSSIENSLKLSQSDNQTSSSLLDTMMASYSKAIQERDEALAKLMASSILNEHKIIQKHMGNGIAANPSATTHRNSDDELQILCKNLGQEIELRTAAEVEVQGLKQKMELDKELAEAKEFELKAELEKYKLLLKNAGELS